MKRNVHLALEKADKGLALAFREYGNKLSGEQQFALNDLRLKLVDIWRRDPFDMTETLRTEMVAEVAKILATESP